VDATVVEFDPAAVPWAVSLATPDERSIRPTLGTTSELELTDAAVEALDPPSEPHAARPNVTRVHKTTLRMCERAAKAGFLIDRYPGFVKRRQGSDTSRGRTTLRPPAAI